MASRPADPADLIDADIAGRDVLARGPGHRRRGSFTLTAMMTPPQPPFQPIPVGNDARRHRGRGLQRRREARPGRRQRWRPTPSRCCWATVTARSSPRSTTRSGPIPTRSWPGTSPATANSTWPSPTAGRRHGLGAAGQRRRHVPAPVALPGRAYPDRDRGGDFTGDGKLDLAVAIGPVRSSTVSASCWATATGRSSPPVTYAVGYPARRHRGRGLQRRRQARPGRRRTAKCRHGVVSILLGNGDGTFQPARSITPAGPYPQSHRGR